MNAVQLNMNNQIQPSKNQQKAYKSYLDAEGAVQTDNKVRPLPPQGHLIHDNIENSVKYFFKDINYDIKSVKNGFNGTANDHQLGRHNDIGLATAGVLIATYLASQTANPKARIMEYVGLGAFLTAMSVYPKIAINTPAKLLHGYDIDKQYIDDQGRKKSVMQDSNYVPYDMYLGDVPDEDMTKIGDKMGIPRDIKNRNDVIREQMRKIATQNNTLWMLTAGVTPALAALLCCGLENYVVGPALEKANISKYNKAVENVLSKTLNMSLDIDSIHQNKVSSKVEKLLSDYKGQELPKDEFENLLDILSDDMYENTKSGIREDLSKILGQSANKGAESITINSETSSELVDIARNSISKNNKDSLEKVLVPTKEEFEAILKRFVSADANLEEGAITNIENISQIKSELKQLIDSKLQSIDGVPKEFLNSQRNDIIENISKKLQSQKSSFVSEDSIKQVVDFAKVIGEFQENQKVLRDCKKFNVEFTNETLIARSYSKFEETLLDELGIKFSELKKMRESENYTKEILDKKFTELCKDETRYKKTMEKLGKVVSEMEIKLNGKSDSNSRLLELVHGIENNYNNTARRLDKIGNFENTINKLVKEDVQTLKYKYTTRQDFFDFLDGIVENKYKDGIDWGKATEQQKLEYIKYHADGLGSSKNLEISRILERYQGSKNSFNRVMHTLDVYRRATNPEKFAESLAGKDAEFVNEVIKFGKESLLNASASEHTMKLNTVNNPNFYKAVMNSIYTTEAGEIYNSTKAKGLISESTKDALKKFNELENGNVLDRFQRYITRFKNIVANSTIDFTKPNHILDHNIRNQYVQSETTRMATFNLIGQTPVDMAKGAAGRRFATQKWVRIIGGITGGVFGIAVASQFFFGKLNNPHNLQKQVNNDTSK